MASTKHTADTIDSYSRAAGQSGGHQDVATCHTQAKRLFKQTSVGHVRHRPRMPTNLERKLQQAREALCNCMRGNKIASNLTPSSMWAGSASNANNEEPPEGVDTMQSGGSNSWVPLAGGCKKQPALHKACVVRTRTTRSPTQASPRNHARSKHAASAGADLTLQASDRSPPFSLTASSPSHKRHAAAAGGSGEAAAVLAACAGPYKQSHLSILPTCTQQWEQDKTLFYNPIGPLAGIAPYQFTGTLRKGLMMFFSPLKAHETLKKWEHTHSLLRDETSGLASHTVMLFAFHAGTQLAAIHAAAIRMQLEAQADSAAEQQQLDGSSEADGNLVQQRINSLAARLGVHPQHLWHLLQLGAESNMGHESSHPHISHASVAAAVRQSAAKKHLLQRSEIDADGRAFVPSAWPQYLRETSPNARINTALQSASHASHTLNGTPLGSVKMRGTQEGAACDDPADNTKVEKAAVECPHSPSQKSSFKLQSNMSVQVNGSCPNSPTTHLPALSVQRQSSSLKPSNASLTPRQSGSLHPRQSLTAIKASSMRRSSQLSRMQSSNDMVLPRNREPFSTEGRRLSQRYLSATRNEEWNPLESGSVRPGMDSLWEHQAGVYDVELANLLQQLAQDRKAAKNELPVNTQEDQHAGIVNPATPRQVSSRKTQLPQSPQLASNDPPPQPSNVGLALPSSRSVPWPEHAAPAHATARHPIFRDSNHAMPATKSRHAAGSPDLICALELSSIPPPPKQQDVRQMLGKSLIRQIIQQQADHTCHLYPDPSRHNLLVAKPRNDNTQSEHNVCDTWTAGSNFDKQVADASVLGSIQQLAKAFGVSLDETGDHSSALEGANPGSLSRELYKLHEAVAIQRDVSSPTQQTDKDTPDSPSAIYTAKQQSDGCVIRKRTTPLLKYRTSKQAPPMIELQSKTFAASQAVINYLQDAQYTRHMLWAAEKQLTPLRLKQMSKQANIPLDA